jgi:macrolide transport system ATP-binding/permease protein
MMSLIRRVTWWLQRGRKEDELTGTMTCAVARRMREMGIRMALGARRGVIVWMVLREVCLLAALGLAVGVPIVLGTSRVVQSFLFDIKPNDPATLTLAVAILLCTSLLAGFAPARSASRINPMIVLRQD